MEKYVAGMRVKKEIKWGEGMKEEGGLGWWWPEGATHDPGPLALSFLIS